MTYALRTCKDGDLFGLRWKRDERAVVPSYASEGTRKPTSGGSKSSYSRRLCRPSFFLSYRGSGEVIHLFARCQRIPSRRARVARMVSPETRLCVSPSSKATSAAISKVHRLVSWPNSLGERWSICCQPLGTLFIEGGAGSLGARGASFQGGKATLVEIVDGVAHRLGAAPQRAGYSRGAFTPLAGEDDLGSAHDKSVFGAKRGSHLLFFGVRK